MRALDKCLRSVRLENSRKFQAVEFCLNEYGGLYDKDAPWIENAEDVADWTLTGAERFPQGGERYLCVYVDSGRVFADTEKITWLPNNDKEARHFFYCEEAVIPRTSRLSRAQYLKLKRTA
jgi:hypothetical protein